MKSGNGVFRGHRERHPSGKPIRADNKRVYADGFRNTDEPRTARLRREHRVEAIGFTARLSQDEFDEE